MKKFLSCLGIFAAGVIAVSLIFTILAHVARKNNPPAEEVFGDGATTISITAVGDCFFGSDINAVGPGDFDDVFKKAGSDYSYCFKNVKRSENTGPASSKQLLIYLCGPLKMGHKPFRSSQFLSLLIFFTPDSVSLIYITFLDSLGT